MTRNAEMTSTLRTMRLVKFLEETLKDNEAKIISESPPRTVVLTVGSVRYLLGVRRSTSYMHSFLKILPDCGWLYTESYTFESDTIIFVKVPNVSEDFLPVGKLSMLKKLSNGLKLPESHEEAEKYATEVFMDASLALGDEEEDAALMAVHARKKPPKGPPASTIREDRIPPRG